jgi:RNA polymerase sigma-70 factor (ECF subfamily)
MQVAAVSERAFGEPTGLEKAFREHHGRVFRAARRITGNPQDAEDILQTVFLRLAQKGDLTADNVPSYLYRAAINASIDLIRARREGAVSLDEAARTLRSVENPERARESVEVREWLRRALASVPAPAAEMFALRYIEGHGNSEIARMLGVSRVRVAVSLHRTRNRLRQALRQRKESQ